MHVPSENQVLAEFYNEIVAALLKCYMLLQLSYMVQTVNDLGKRYFISIQMLQLQL